jgi:hypothetical protein
LLAIHGVLLLASGVALCGAALLFRQDVKKRFYCNDSPLEVVNTMSAIYSFNYFDQS